MDNLKLILFGTVACLFLGVFLFDWFKNRRFTASLQTRPQRTDDQFARDFYPDPARAAVAIRVRQVLARNLQIPAGPITPNDRLNEDLHAEFPSNPHLLWELENEFGSKMDDDDLDAFSEIIEHLITFQDLVDHVESRIADPQFKVHPETDEAKTPRWYDCAVRSIPILCIAGIATVITGVVLQKKSLQALGTAIFLSGIAVWGFANAGGFLGVAITDLRSLSFKEAIRKPIPLIFTIGLGLFFLWVGGIVLWMVLKNLLSLK